MLRDDGKRIQDMENIPLLLFLGLIATVLLAAAAAFCVNVVAPTQFNAWDKTSEIRATRASASKKSLGAGRSIYGTINAYST